MIALNPEVSHVVIIPKAQKIIDRLIFIHFCEDLGLLPEWKLKQYVERAKEFDFSTREIVQKVFKWVDKGSDKLGIPDGYNGGLFHDDPVLNNLEVGEDICHKFVELGDYDFADDLSVNILGHIFEQSISDLEDLRNHFSEDEDKGTSKRKKDGIFYTPEYIVDYIVKNSLGVRLEERFDEIKKKVWLKWDITDKNYEKRELEAYGLYQQVLQNVKVLDPACGSWAFLVRVFDYLLAENERVWTKLWSLFDNQTTYKSILQNNIYWVDLNEESVEITKLSLWLKTAEKGKKLADLDGNIKCGNSLIDDPVVAGDKAFVWGEEYKDIMDSWGFDVVVGNPPYVATKMIEENDREYFRKKYWKYLFSEMDLYEIFSILSINSLISKDWYLWFITPNTYFTNKSFNKYRRLLFTENKVCSILDFPHRYYPFEDVNKETAIMIVKNTKSQEYNIKYFSEDDKKTDYFTCLNNVNTISFKSFVGTYKSHVVIKGNSIITKMIDASDTTLWTYIDLHKWWMSIPESTITSTKTYDQTIISKSDIEYNPELKSKVYPALEWKDIHRYFIDDSWKFVNLKWIDLKTKWWHFNKKIILQRIVWQNKIKFYAYLDENNYVIFPSANLINIKDDSGVEIETILGLLNSKTINYYYAKYHWESNTNITKTAVEDIVLPSKISWYNDKIKERVFSIQTLVVDINRKLNDLVKFLQSRYSLEKIPKKLQKFTELDFDSFKKVLKLKKLSLEDEEELMSWFHKKHTALSELQSQIDSLDAEIDEMVFDLYGLSEEEREIVRAG